MATLGINEAFTRYGASLRNVQWSVSAWTPGGELVVSLWAHHVRPSAKGTLEFAGSAGRWKGPGNTEFRANVDRAFRSGATVRLVVATAYQPERVDAGEDGSKLKKDFDRKEDLIGRIVEWDGENYAFRFTRK